MINCPNCNHQNPDGALQCEACYTPLPAMATCPNCGASIQADASFCGQCGTDLRDVSTESTATGNTAPDEAETVVSGTIVSEAGGFGGNTETGSSTDSGALKTQNFINPEANAPAPDVAMPDLVTPDPLIVPEPITPAIEPEETPENALEGEPENETEGEPESEPANTVEPLIKPPAMETPAPAPAATPTPAPTPAPAAMPTPAPAVRPAATQLQVSSVKLKQVQTDTLIELPRQLSVVRIGKPNEHTPPDIDVSGFPDSEIVSRVHANIRVEGDTYFLEDVGSSNGTYINGLPLPVGNRHRLRSGDRIALGKGDKVSFIFENA